MSFPSEQELQSIKDEVNQPTSDLMDELHTKNLLLDIIGQQSSEFTKIWNVVLRHANNQFVLIKKSKIRNTSNESYLKNVANTNFNEQDEKIDFVHHLASYILSEFELLKRFLRVILNQNQLGFTNTATYGRIINDMADNTTPSRDDLKNLFDVGLRDMLAHDSWLINNNCEVYYVDIRGSTITLSLDELFRKAYRTYYLQTAILLKYFEFFKQGSDELTHLTQIFQPNNSGS